jgi:hypothetical protein
MAGLAPAIRVFAGRCAETLRTLTRYGFFAITGLAEGTRSPSDAL